MPFSVDSGQSAFVNVDPYKIDTGVYMIRGKYKQKCGSKVIENYTEGVYFIAIH